MQADNVPYTVHTSLGGLAPENTEKKTHHLMSFGYRYMDCITFEPLGYIRVHVFKCAS